jgi:uncharacterized protein YdeI (YjbR/CyaY-like superfamily)
MVSHFKGWSQRMSALILSSWPESTFMHGNVCVNASCGLQKTLMIETDHFNKVEVTSPAQLRTWIQLHHTQTESVWLVTYKKQVTEKHVSVDEVLDGLLCFGWIDGVRRKLDADRTMQLIGPRRVHHWAASYKVRADRLMAEGRMHPAGLATIAESKRLGLWDAMSEVDALVVPPDLALALRGHPGTAKAFSTMAPSYRRNVLRWIKLAKTPPTRAKRIEQAVDAAARNQKLPHM